MQNSLSSDSEWVKNWLDHVVNLANNSDLSSREIDSYTEKMAEQACNDDLTQIIKALLNHIRMHK
ncbi:hypothetical protein EYY83_12475 [Hafnia alvei]|uniref:hypothetical protein n=1 Tax=Hafnia alvei TaxID=569 RepID=UPI0010342FF2|nr:hypothetical protein [Hafnia alvei]TBL64064.1 hypothetical protein EYY92_00215 [Hafnia alvei]TBM13638.1 hypothetical protein EYY83_12475 [Hafnia alvei]